MGTHGSGPVWTLDLANPHQWQILRRGAGSWQIAHLERTWHYLTVTPWTLQTLTSGRS